MIIMSGFPIPGSVVVTGSKALELERIALHTISEPPWNFFRHWDSHKFGVPEVRSFIVACAFALYRIAVRIVTAWASLFHQMTAVTKEHLLAVRESRGLDYFDFWDSPSFEHIFLGAYEQLITQEG